MAEDKPALSPARARAEESIATRFTRIMNATTSRYGVLSDPPIVALCTSPLLIALLAARQVEADPLVINALSALVALPLLVAVGVSLALRGARRKVVDWLSGLPFPVENMNAVLNGLGEGLEITFAGECPLTPALNAELDKVSPDAFVTRAPDVVDGASELAPRSPRPAVPEAEGSDGKAADRGQEPRLIEVRIGVVDSKRNPARTNHERFDRVKALISSVFVPLHARFAVEMVRIK